MSLERRHLQNLIRRFDQSGKWPVDEHDKALAQAIIDSPWMRKIKEGVWDAGYLKRQCEPDDSYNVIGDNPYRD